MQFYNAKENLVDHLCAQIFKCQPLLPAEFVDCLFTGIHGCYNKKRNDALGKQGSFQREAEKYPGECLWKQIC